VECAVDRHFIGQHIKRCVIASILAVLAAVSYLAWNGVKSASTIWMMVLYGMGFTGSVAFVVTILLRRRAFLSAAGQAVATDADADSGLGLLGPWWTLGIVFAVGIAVNAWERRNIRKRIAMQRAANEPADLS
jgi:hypothetical protein